MPKGVYPRTVRPLIDRFWEKVQQDDPTQCWQWLGRLNDNGYGRLSVGGRAALHELRAHRVAYELLVGTIPADLELDHLCRNRGCVNPAHLEPVTRRENLLRGETIAAVNARKTVCANGHPYDAVNTRIYRGGRRCRRCAVIYTNRQLARRREMAGSASSKEETNG